jgi:hypothetical protein
MRKPFGAFLVARLGMGPSWGEVDDLALMHAENSVRTALHQQRQVGEGTEATVAHQDVVLAQPRMDLRHPGDVMGMDRCGHGVQEHPGADVEE